MINLNAVLNDYPQDLKMNISYDVKTINAMKSVWDSIDPNLSNLHSIPEFKGYTRWCELTISHYRFLIARGLDVISDMDREERNDLTNPDVAMTYFLILAFVYKLELLTESEMDFIRIHRFSKYDVTFDYTGSFSPQYDKPKPMIIPMDEFSIVVDNSHEN